jgi:hypothetical protein
MPFNLRRAITGQAGERVRKPYTQPCTLIMSPSRALLS